MELLINLDINILAFILLIIICTNLKRNNSCFFSKNKLFIFLIIINCLLILLGSFKWIIENTNFFANETAHFVINTIYYMLFAFPASFLGLYIDYQVHQSKIRMKKLIIPYLIPIMINSILVLTNTFHKALFYFDNSNNLKLGNLYTLFIALSYIMLLLSFVNISFNRNKIEKRNLQSLLLILFPPMICCILQIIFYKLSLIWCGMTISTILIFLQLRNQIINLDYLTNAYNRQYLDYYLESKIKNINPSKSFAGIMIDADNFKLINDCYGHTEGDEALKTIVKIIKECFKPCDFISRYAGDEFVIIVNFKKEDDLKKIITKIKNKLHSYNMLNIKPYNLSVSAGYGIYRYNSNMKTEEFIKHIDACMYLEKKRKKESRNYYKFDISNNS
ncbi:GGDEF domain-containing protein [Abyssisolibacter fermentans]|uniref:GGDEF domain-containing protein n=1 Tax=Abyssisolibacter fermentans TaxID=1766203 RepID=UPI000831B1AE|nr:diguanylate cyclase [Abyssisolibacter fermentans]